MGMFSIFGREDNSSSTENLTSNSTTNTDNSKMFGDNAVDGSGNSWLDISNRSTNFADSSNRSTNFYDLSDKSTNFEDKSNRSYSGNSGSFNTSNTTLNDITNHTFTDYGSVGSALSALGSVGGAAVTSNGQSVNSALDSVKFAAAANAAGVAQAFGLAQKVAESSEKTAAQIMGFATNAANLPSNSTAAKTEEQKAKMQKYVLIAVAVLGGLWVMKKA